MSRFPRWQAHNRFKTLVALGALAGMLGRQVRSRPPVPPPPGSTSSTTAVRDAGFTDVAARSGVSFHHSAGATHSLTILQTAGAGCAFFDYDNDGWLDLFLVGSASSKAGVRLHALYRTNRDGSFTEVPVAAGIAGSGYGMGCVATDYDGDGRPDLLFTNFQHEGAGLYHNEGNRGFFAAADRAGVLAATLPVLGFGAGFLDFDNDGRLDLFMVNGHVQGAIQQVDPACTFAQPRQLFRNRGAGAFEDFAATCGPAMTTPAVGRGAASGHYDNDGDVDILVNNNGGPAMLLRDEACRQNHWLRLRLIGRAPIALRSGRGSRWWPVTCARCARCAPGTPTRLRATSASSSGWVAIARRTVWSSAGRAAGKRCCGASRRTKRAPCENEGAPGRRLEGGSTPGPFSFWSRH